MDSQETKIYTAILIAASVLGIIVVYFVISIIRNQRKHLRLQRMNLLVEITTLENERKRIVSDLHDELGPLLSVVKFQLMGMDIHDEEDSQAIEKASNNLDDVVARIRSICNHLMPQVLINKGLVTAVHEFVGDFKTTSFIDMKFSHEPGIVIPDEAEVHIYRMVQEMVNNAVKHSEATRLSIHFATRDNYLVITVQDNGKGFESEKMMMESKGFGLKNIRSRVDILGGDLYLASRPGKGTIYTIEIPKS